MSTLFYEISDNGLIHYDSDGYTIAMDFIGPLKEDQGHN